MRFSDVLYISSILCTSGDEPECLYPCIQQLRLLKANRHPLWMIDATSQYTVPAGILQYGSEPRSTLNHLQHIFKAAHSVHMYSEQK